MPSQPPKHHPKHQPATQEHPFATFVRILGKGKTGSRSLDFDEARQAFGMILQRQVEPLQLGAFLMLLRVKEETGEELGGFVQACRDHLVRPPTPIQVDLDWSSYAGKKHQHPWFILSILLLTGAGFRVFLHGSSGHTPGRLYTEAALQQLGLPNATDWPEVAQQLDTVGLSYLPLQQFCPVLDEIMQFKSLLGLRSPVNSLARMLNPLGADATLQSIFHPAYAALHQRADLLLHQPRSLVFKGESGEAEIKPQANTRMHLLASGVSQELVLQRVMEGRVASIETPAVEPLLALWHSQPSADEESYGLATVLSTTAAALILLKPQLSPVAARNEAAALWQRRERRLLR